MQISDFLKQVSDESGPIQDDAAELIERMSKADFEELMGKIKASRDLIEAMTMNDEIAVSNALMQFPEIFFNRR